MPPDLPPGVDGLDTTDLGARRLGSVAVVAVITVLMLIVLAVGIDVRVFVISSPVMG